MTEFLVISDFNIQNLVAILNNLGAAENLRAEAASYGQVMQMLLAADESVWSSHDGVIVWTAPSAVSTTYRLAVEGSPVDPEKLRVEVAEFAGGLKRIPATIKHIFVPTWIPIQPAEDRRGMLDMDREYGLAAALMRMNLQLQEALQSDKRARVFNAARWIASTGEAAYSTKLWYLSKTPFSVDLFRQAAADLTAAMRGLAGRARKLLILDLDNTLWDGVVGESGWHALRLGGHHPTGEALRDFQLGLRSLRRRGVLLGLVSKNEEAAALEAIREHPEMVLRLDDFASWKINWNDKAQNVIDLIAELNLARDAAVFIDDDPAERARVREAVPELLVPDWPKNPLDFLAALRRLDCFDLPVVSVEDRERTSTYVANRRREQQERSAPSLEQWLRTIQLRVEIESLKPVNLDRAVQLLNKTNQMNLRTRRMSPGELTEWSSRPGHHLATFRVSDRFGDYGLVGIGSVALNLTTHIASIEDFVLSCRAMGRRVEETMLCALAVIGSQAGATEMTARYVETSRNKPCLKFFERCCMRRDGNDNRTIFRLKLNSLPVFPDGITLVGLDLLAPTAANLSRVITSSNEESGTGDINGEDDARS